MRRFLLLTRSLSLTQAIRNGLTRNIITNQQASRPFTISSVVHAKRGDPISEDGSDRGGIKKGFLERASDKLSAMSGIDSHSDQRAHSSASRARSTRQRGISADRDGKGGDTTGKMSKKASGKLVSHRALNSVKHDKDSHRFTLDLGDNEVAHIDYKPVGKNMIEMYHTEVPERLRGRGIGKALARGALECASRSNLRFKVTCDYLEDYVERFADEKYKKLIIK